MEQFCPICQPDYLLCKILNNHLHRTCPFAFFSPQHHPFASLIDPSMWPRTLRQSSSMGLIVVRFHKCLEPAHGGPSFHGTGFLRVTLIGLSGEMIVPRHLSKIPVVYEASQKPRLRGGNPCVWTTDFSSELPPLKPDQVRHTKSSYFHDPFLSTYFAISS